MEKKINTHVDRIKNKINVIKCHNTKLIELNYKLEALLEAFEAFSIQSDSTIKEEITNKLTPRPIEIVKEKPTLSKRISKTITAVEETPTRKKIQENVHYTPSKKAIEELSNLQSAMDSNLCSQNDSGFNELVTRVVSSNRSSKVNRMHIIKVLNVLNSSGGAMLLDDVIKASGISKYKCIDVLNILLKSEPPAITKKFDKGFIYSINLDQ